MRSVDLVPLLIAATVAWAAPPATAQETTPSNGNSSGKNNVHIPAKLHAWGEFRPGAWKQVSITTETLEEGKISGTTISATRTELLEQGDEECMLLITSNVEVAGKIIEVEPERVRQGYHGEVICKNVEIRSKRLEPEDVAVGGKPYSCEVLQVETVCPTSQTTTVIAYNLDIAPYVLRRTSKTVAIEDGDVLSETQVRVTALEMPLRIGGEVLTTAVVRVDHQNHRSRTVAETFTSTDVPGGIVLQSAKEIDDQGRVVRRSILEIVDYGLEPAPEPEGRTGLLPRLRSSLHSRMRR